MSRKRKDLTDAHQLIETPSESVKDFFGDMEVKPLENVPKKEVEKKLDLKHVPKKYHKFL
jgi:hypothetical protein